MVTIISTDDGNVSREYYLISLNKKERMRTVGVIKKKKSMYIVYSR